MTPNHKTQVLEILQAPAAESVQLKAIDEVLQREVETNRANDLMCDHDSFRLLLRGLHAQGLLNADTLRGAFAAKFCRGINIQDVTDPCDTPLRLVDWAGLADFIRQQFGARGGWNVLPNTYSQADVSAERQKTWPSDTQPPF
jgi:hypothetical protein